MAQGRFGSQSWTTCDSEWMLSLPHNVVFIAESFDPVSFATSWHSPLQSPHERARRQRWEGSPLPVFVLAAANLRAAAVVNSVQARATNHHHSTLELLNETVQASAAGRVA